MTGMNIEEELKSQVESAGNLPCHIAIIMDGNGRWARSRKLPRIAGHKEGINSVREITRACGEMGIGYLTLYTFSQENWSRPRMEVSALMNLLVETIRREIDELMENNVCLHVIGRMEELPEKPRVEMEEGIRRTAENNGLNLVLALNYGGRIEILDAVTRLCQEQQDGLDFSELTEQVFEKYLYTEGMPDPDMVIRTSGESRVSNFLLWQMAYSEIIITSTLWPAFRRKELYEAILVFQSRERRFGKVSEQLPEA
ncbi:MAG TPA: isoprenyl transferase [Candidatus Marinimicrobia bacterium]|jgi:undecaprenyl diphosphate synthase|nr:isoprenyl transferase [Candidatus Neomarinimicrobiota bacterium]|tara:strand:+ start:3032 stop:3799 length:768 start_codon:yes stop_codon:yes gene_type:complete